MDPSDHSTFALIRGDLISQATDYRAIDRRTGTMGFGVDTPHFAATEREQADAEMAGGEQESDSTV